jgi:MFS family permease
VSNIKSYRYGGRWFFGAGIGFCSLLSLLMPAATYLGAGYLIGLRVLQGFTQGFIFPAMHCLWSKWSPPYEYDLKLNLKIKIVLNLN